MRESFLRFAMIKVLVLAVLVGSMAAQDTPLAVTGPGVLTQFEIAKGGAAIVVPVTLRDKEYAFLLDTGATHSLYDTSLKPFLGEVVKTQDVITQGGTVKMESFAWPEAFLGPLSLKTDKPVMCADLTMLRQVTGEDFYGIVGMDVLKNHVVQIDFDKGALCFFAGGSKTDGSWGETIQIEYRLGWPTVWGVVSENIRAPFILDTGYNGTAAIPREILDDLVQHGLMTVVSETMVATAGGTGRIREGMANNFSVGSFEHADLLFGGGETPFPLLGLSYLSRYCVTLDLPERRLYLNKGGRFSEVDNPRMSGLNLLRIDGRTVVHSVEKNSPAEKVGIQAEDIVVEINGKGTSEFSMFAISKLLREEEGKRISLRIQRAQNVREVAFVLRKYYVSGSASSEDNSTTTPVERQVPGTAGSDAEEADAQSKSNSGSTTKGTKER